MIVQSQGIHFIINTVALVTAYVISVTCAGAFQAWVCKKMGDVLPERQGFLTLDPLVHVDIVGAFCLLFFGIGWGKFMIFDYALLRGWRLLTVLFSRSGMYLLMSYSAYLILLSLFGTSIFPLVVATVSGSINISSAPLFLLYRSYPLYSSFTLLCSLFLIMLLYIGCMMASIHIILKLIKVVELNILPRMKVEPPDFVLYIGAFFTMIFFGPFIRFLFLKSIVALTDLWLFIAHYV